MKKRMVKQMEKKELLYEGKAKKVYTTEDQDVLIVSYKDDATAFNGQKKGTIVGKGVINNRMSNHVFKLVEKAFYKMGGVGHIYGDIAAA